MNNGYTSKSPKLRKKKDSHSRQRRRARQAAARQQASAEQAVNEETETEKVPYEDAEKAKEIYVQVEKETEAEQASADIVENTCDIIVEEIAVVEEITDELCSNADNLETSEKPKYLDSEVIDKVELKSQYPRHCEYGDKYIRSNLDFRKHVVPCMMARK